MAPSSIHASSTPACAVGANAISGRSVASNAQRRARKREGTTRSSSTLTASMAPPLTGARRPRWWLCELHAVLLHDLGDLLDERGLVMPLPVLPVGERRGVGAVDEDLAVEVIALVLVRPGSHARHFDVVRGAGSIQVLHADARVPLHHAAQIGDGEAALVVVELVVAHLRDARIHDDRERNRRLVG